MSPYPLVTIAIPTYNRADGFLREAVTSALGQTYPNIELIVSDNCSQDKTPEVIESFKAPSIKYFRQAVNLGPQRNFNFCVEKASGDYFLLLHDDDLIDEDFIESCMKAAEFKTDKGIIRTGTRIIDKHGNILNNYSNMAVGLPTEEFFRSWFEGKTALYLCSTLFNAERLKEIGGFASKHNLFNDVFAELKLAAKYGRADVQDIKASFRKHDEEITFSTKVSAWCEDSLMLLDLMCDLIPEHKSLVKNEGARFLSKLNYSLAGEVKYPLRRFLAYIIVFRSYRYRYLPPPVEGKLRYLNRRLKQLLGR